MRLCQRSCNGATAPSWLQFPLQFEAPHCQFREELGAIGSLARWETYIVMNPWLMKQACVYRFWSQFAQFWGTSLQFNQSTKALFFQGGHGKKQNPVNLRTSRTSRCPSQIMTLPPSKRALIQLWRTHECLLMRVWSPFPCPARLSLTVGPCRCKSFDVKKTWGNNRSRSFWAPRFVNQNGYSMSENLGEKTNPMVYVV